MKFDRLVLGLCIATVIYFTLHVVVAVLRGTFP